MVMMHELSKGRPPSSNILCESDRKCIQLPYKTWQTDTCFHHFYNKQHAGAYQFATASQHSACPVRPQIHQVLGVLSDRQFPTTEQTSSREHVPSRMALWAITMPSISMGGWLLEDIGGCALRGCKRMMWMVFVVVGGVLVCYLLVL